MIMIGSCLCKKIKIEVNLLSKNIHACFCGMCQKWSNGGLYVLEDGFFDEESIISDKTFLSEFESSDIASRTFCNNCGTVVSYRTKQGKNYFNVGMFENVDFKISKIYDENVNKKPAYLL